jgi:hypothetical protein
MARSLVHIFYDWHLISRRTGMCFQVLPKSAQKINHFTHSVTLVRKKVEKEFHIQFAKVGTGAVKSSTFFILLSMLKIG